MTQQIGLEFLQFSCAREMNPVRQRELVDCWVELDTRAAPRAFPPCP
ncbi:hypothetical protein ACIBM4_05850 [Streptomyces sp. NPDC050256]